MKPTKKGKKEIRKSEKKSSKKIIKKVIKKETKKQIKIATTKKEMKKIVSKSKETPNIPKKQVQKPQKHIPKEITYVELKVKCNECGKESRIVIVEGSDTSDYLCPKCSTGDFFEEDDDFG